MRRIRVGIRLNDSGDARGIGNPEQKRLNRFVGSNHAIGEKIARYRAIEVKAAEPTAGKHVGVQAGQITVIPSELERVLALVPSECVQELYSPISAQGRRGSTGALIPS